MKTIKKLVALALCATLVFGGLPVGWVAPVEVYAGERTAVQLTGAESKTVYVEKLNPTYKGSEYTLAGLAKIYDSSAGETEISSFEITQGSTVDVTSAGTIADLSITGSGDTYGGYTGTITGLTIAKKAVTVKGLTAENKTYDTTKTATITGTPSLNGVIEADKNYVALDTTNASALFSDENVGTNKTVTLSGYSLSGDKAGNYELSQSSNLKADG